MNDERKGTPYPFVRPPPEHALAGRTDGRKSTIGLDGIDDVVDMLENAAELLLALAQVFLRTLAYGDFLVKTLQRIPQAAHVQPCQQPDGRDQHDQQERHVDEFPPRRSEGKQRRIDSPSSG